MSVGKNKGTTRKTTAGKPVDKDKLSQAFQVVREQFFPKWDRAKRWRVRQVDYLDESQGKCCRDRKEIQILNFPDGEERNLLLIHEIAHAFDLGHEERWQARIKSALDTAEQLGRTELAGLLREELAQYRIPRAENRRKRSIKLSLRRLRRWGKIKVGRSPTWLNISH